jgi:hypothetical protein
LPPPPPPPEEEEVDNFKIGPLLGLGLPSLLSIGGTMKITEYFGAGLTYGVIPTIQLSLYGEATVSYHHLDFYGRIYPFGGAFFIGAGAGYATIEAELENTFDVPTMYQQAGLPASITYDSKGSVKTLVLTPTIGLLHTFDVGFSLGIDAGVQLPIAPSEITYERSSTQIPNAPQALVNQLNQFATPIDEGVKDTLETVGRTPLPTFNLRIGWLL